MTMPFDQWQRYEVLRALVGDLGQTAPAVLDVGGYDQDLGGVPVLPAAEILDRARPVVVDRVAAVVTAVERGRGLVSQARYVQADAKALPFHAGAFDIVSSLDVIEHVPRADRLRVIAELARVSRGYVVVAVPIGDDGAAGRERIVARFVREVLKGEQQQLKEHEEFGLPTHGEMLDIMPPGTISFGYGNIERWLVMMLAKHLTRSWPHGLAAHDALDAGYRTLDPGEDRRPPFYRRFYLAMARPDVARGPIERVAARYAPLEASTDAAALLAWALGIVAGADAARLAAERAPLEARVRDLRAVLDEVEASTVYRLYRLTRRSGQGTRGGGHGAQGPGQ